MISRNFLNPTENLFELRPTVRPLSSPEGNIEQKLLDLFCKLLHSTRAFFRQIEASFNSLPAIGFQREALQGQKRANFSEGFKSKKNSVFRLFPEV
ncbi:hypothetical protein J6590_064625 [Homalodisca vitripennis]|nr:hypothetical protein J6590_064625 [Homalodisca vitripennis]